MPGEIDYRRMLPLMFAVFVNIAGFSLILPLLPFYGPLFGAGAFEVALLFAAYSLGNVFGEIFWGRQSDRWGRRAVLVATTTGAAITYVAFAYAPGLWLAIGIRVVNGFFGGTLSVAQGFLADSSPPRRYRRLPRCGRCWCCATRARLSAERRRCPVTGRRCAT
jgi:MFS family permease